MVQKEWTEGYQDWSGLNWVKVKAGLDTWIIKKTFLPWSASLYLLKSCKNCETDITNHQHILWVLKKTYNHRLGTRMVSRITTRVINRLVSNMLSLHCHLFNTKRKSGSKDKVLWICTVQCWKLEAQHTMYGDVIYRCLLFCPCDILLDLVPPNMDMHDH